MISELIKSAEYLRLAIISYSSQSHFKASEVARLYNMFISVQDALHVFYDIAYYNQELNPSNREKLKSIFRFNPEPYFSRLRSIYSQLDLFD